MANDIASIYDVPNIEHATIEDFGIGYRITTNPDEYLIHLSDYDENDPYYEQSLHSYKWCVIIHSDFDWNHLHIVPRSELPEDAEITSVKDKPEIS